MYMLDTNMIIYAIKGKPETVMRNITSHKHENICISSITYAELAHGVEKSKNAENNWLALTLMLANIKILDFDSKAAEEYGNIRSALEVKGMIIGPMDLLIVAHAKSENCVLVTNNLSEFKRVKNLKFENWTK